MVTTTDNVTNNSWEISEFADFFDVDNPDGPSTSDSCVDKAVTASKTSKTQVNKHSISYDFDFDSFGHRNELWIESPILKYHYKGDHQWRIIIYPYGTSPDIDDRFVSVHSKLERSKKPTVASLKLKIVDCYNANVYGPLKTLPCVCYEGQSMGLRNFLRRDDLYEDPEFKSRSGLRLQCTITYEEDDRASWPYISNLDRASH